MQIDHVHFYVEDATASQDWFVNQLGFQAVASFTGNHTRTEIVKNGPVYFFLSSPLTASSPAGQFLQQHPDGIADVAFRVQNIDAVMTKAIAAGAQVLQPVRQQTLNRGHLKWSQIAGWGDLKHTLIEAIDTQEDDVCNFLGRKSAAAMGDVEFTLHPHSKVKTQDLALQLTGIDHVVLNVAAGDLKRAVTWYEKTLGFQPQQAFAIQTERSGLHSQVMVHADGVVQLPINEPTSVNSQIQEFLDINRGSGIQHIALRTGNIVPLVEQLRHKGLPFIQVPPTYYTQLRCRHKVHLAEAEWEEIERSRVLVDWHEETPDALLLQIFTQPIFGQPTFFFELIERRLHARGFGEGNFRALFEAIEQEQLKRSSRNDTFLHHTQRQK